MEEAREKGHITYPESLNKLSDRIISPTINLALTLDAGYDGYLSVRKFFNAGEVYLYHYTSVSSAQNILKFGMNTEYSSDGFLYLTNKGNLSPLQAQIELAFPANRPLPTSILRINAKDLEPFMIRRATGNLPGMGAGGGNEFLFNQNISSDLIHQK
ncbi:hypothetical protein [Arachidicoccus sp.]|uniref:hypothetical protein n=1 Tax=Arachidicoccus sp. TaxID=1872624 RepID=UPI003D251E04